MSIKSMFSRGNSKTGQGGKVNKVLGPENADDIAKGILSGEIILQPAEYANFWSRITKDRSTCARYMARIVILLLSFEKDPIKTEKSLGSKKYGTVDGFITILLNTLQFLDMFVGYDPSSEAFVSAMETYETAKRNTPMFRNKRIDDGLYGLARRRANRGQAAVKMLVDCSTLESEEEMRQSASSTAIASNGDRAHDFDEAVDNAVMDFPFTFTALTRMSRAEVSSLIFDEMLKQLEGAGSALSSMAAMQGRTLALMYILRELLTISPTADQVWMQRASEVLIGLYKWPKPYGVVARDLLDFVSLERRSPGCHLRDRLFEENPELLPASLRTQSSTGATRHHAVYLFLDKTQPLCCTNRYLLLSDTERARSGTVDSSNSKHLSTSMQPLGKVGCDGDKRMQLQRDILLHILDLDFHVRDKPSGNHKAQGGDDFLNLEDKEDALVLQWLERALRVVERAKSLPVISDIALGGHGHEVDIPGGLAKLYRESYLGSLLAEICPDRQFSPRRSPDEVRKHRRKSRPGSLSFPIPLEELQSAKLKTTSTDALESGDANREMVAEAVINPDPNPIPPPPDIPLQFPLPFGQQAPNIPDITFRVFDVDPIDGEYMPESPGLTRGDTMATSQMYLSLRNPSGYAHVFQDTDEIMRMMSEALTSWQEIHGSSSKSFIDAEHKLVVKAVLMGCDTVVHRFLCAYVVLLTDHPDIADKIQLELFLVPVGHNKLGTYLARSDKWYRRHIYDSFKSGLGICPQYPVDMECSLEAMKEAGMERALPVTSLRKLLQDYVRQAKNVYPICVFEVLCWAAAEESSNRDSVGSKEEADPSQLLSQQSSPDIVIPFVMQIEIGVNAQLAHFKNTVVKTSLGDHNRSNKDLLGHKDLNLVPVDLSVSYILSSMSGSEGEGVRKQSEAESSGSKIDSFATLCFSNFPVSRSSRDDHQSGAGDSSETHTVPNGPHFNFLVMSSQGCRGAIADAYANRKRNQRAVDTFMECLRDPDSQDAPQPISAVEVDVVNTRDKFHILVDGTVYGPFRRIVIRSCQVGVGSSQQSMMTIPILTNTPIGGLS